MVVDTPFILLLLVAVLALIWTRCLVPRRQGPGRRGLIGLLSATAWWSACILCENLPIPLADRVLCDHLSYFGMAMAASCFCSLLWEATFLGRRPVARGWWVAAYSFAAFAGCAAVFNPYHLIDLSVAPAPGNQGPPRFDSGPLYYIIIAIIYVALLSTIGYTAWWQRGRSTRRRRLYGGIVAALAAPMIVGAVNVLFDLQYPAEDPTPFTFLLTAPLLARLITRNGLCDPMPIARSALLDILPDAVIVLNAEGRVVEANIGAHGLPDLPAPLTGLALAAMGVWRQPIETMLTGHKGPLALTIPREPAQYYEVSATRLEEDGVFCGHLVVVRDMTLRQSVEMRLRAALADLGTQLAENLRLQTELYGQARRDPLTNLYNRRALDEALPALLANAAGTPSQACVAMIDIDHFKKINDAYGHGFGDEVLRVFASNLLAMSRKDDVLFRLGGEEFLVLLPNTTEFAAVDILKRWLAACRAGLMVEGRDLSVTFSAGVASTNAAKGNGPLLLVHADAAVYRAKRHGRNQVVTHSSIEALAVLPAAG